MTAVDVLAPGTAGAADDGRAGVGASGGRTNVGNAERLVSGVLGGALLAYGLERRSLGGAALALLGGDLLYRGVTGHSPLYRALGVRTTDGTVRVTAAAEPATVERTITVGRPAAELHRFWRDPRNLARVLGHLAEVTPLADDRARWVVHAPLGRTLTWDVELVGDRPGEELRWASLPGAPMTMAGRVTFRAAPAGWGTEVALHLDFGVPGGALGRAVVDHLPMAPRLAAERALRRFKSLVETGEMPTLDRNVSARGRGDSW